MFYEGLVIGFIIGITFGVVLIGIYVLSREEKN